MADHASDFFTDNTVSHDFFDLMKGKWLGQGISRDVYRMKHAPELVMKFELAYGSFQNIVENEVWEAVQGTSLEKWFAPCVSISDRGVVLLQKYCEPVREKDCPKQMPDVFTDTKLSNFGMYKGRVVCVDYGLLSPITRNLSARRMVKARWRT